MKIAILGTRGIPNHHGGFEQFAEFFSVFLVNQGHQVYVYNSTLHPYKESNYNGVNLIYCKDYEDKIGTAGQFFYDYNCIINARKHDFDIILQLGYTSSSVWHKFMPKKPIIITNMDGLEWKRSKYNKYVRRFLKYAEKLAVHSSDYLISDSIGIQEYLFKTYNKESEYIAYGADCFLSPNEKILDLYKVEREQYNILIARFEPENNLETILDGASKAKNKVKFLVIGKHDVNSFGEYLKDKYKADDHIKFLGGIYDIEHLNNLRYFSNLYFHGHSVGGTNPSLLEAMASNSLIVANDNIFNKAILETDAFYFENSEQVSEYIDTLHKLEYSSLSKNLNKKIENTYSWDIINNQYLEFFKKVMTKKNQLD
ncbi:DUF1972 domain-containing protein [uncultured Psychroserpens sp.]|uniref:DUF1972 domain-containing protein n=1 Tax=uncultured Psychroserpens sp. TaxID=255436 RepID=UPI0026048AEF|nr:DUF1972 domain-containing protein [uncultured Psychroserpens sp.]